jgi:hypothetical protein
VNNVYVGLKGTIMKAYFDDLGVESDTPKQHVVDVRRVLERTRDANLRLKLAKSTFGKTKVELHGHKVRFEEVRPNDRHRDCLQRFDEPTNVTELLRFLGLLQFFRAHVDHWAELATPLYAVLEGTQWNKRKRKREIIRLAYWEKRWGQAQKESFENLRDVLADSLFLVPASTRKRQEGTITTRILGETVGAGAERIVREPAGCPHRPVVPGASTRKRQEGTVH